MRSFENVVRDGRFRVPKTGTPLLIGAPVTLDTANAGYLKLATAGETPSPGCGVVVFEHILFQGVDPNLTTNVDAPFNRVPLGQYAQMMHGVGTKVWYRNTTAHPLYDGRQRDAVTVVDAAAVVGDFLTPAADGTWAVGTQANGWLYVEQVNPTSGLVEARFAF